MKISVWTQVFLRRRSGPMKNHSHCNCQDLRSLTKENQVSLLRALHSDPESGLRFRQQQPCWLSKSLHINIENNDSGGCGSSGEQLARSLLVLYNTRRRGIHDGREAKFAYQYRVPPIKLMGENITGTNGFAYFYFTRRSYEPGGLKTFEKCPPASTGTKIEFPSNGLAVDRAFLAVTATPSTITILFEIITLLMNYFLQLQSARKTGKV